MFRPLLLLALTALTLTSAAHAGGGGAPTGVRPPAQGCRPDYVRPDFAALTRQLQLARARWAATGIRDYTYDVHQIAAPVLFPDTRVTVVNGRAVGSAVKPGQEGDPTPLSLKTVEGRFDDIASTLAYRRGTRCPEVTIRYDPQRGYPTYLYSGMGDAGIMDGFGEWTVSNFTPTR